MSQIRKMPLCAATIALLLVTGNLAAQDAGSRGAFLMRLGTDTIVIERFERSGDTLQGSISVKGQPRQDYVAVLGPEFSITSLSLNVFQNGPADAAPVQRIRIRMRGDSVLAEVNGAAQGFATQRGAVPLLNNSFALAELFTRQARMARDSADVAAWALAGATPLVVKIRAAGRDSMTLTIGGVEERLRVNVTGQILGGVIPSQRIELSRVGPAIAATLRLGKVDYSAPSDAPYAATEVMLTGPGGIQLGGTLTMPRGTAGRRPAVVTITGSGQQDRDEYIPVAGGYRPFRQVADTLGRRGIAVLR